MFKHTWYYNYATAVPTPLDWGDHWQSRCFQLFFDVLYDVTVNMTRVRRRIGQYFILANTRQYASIYWVIFGRIHCASINYAFTSRKGDARTCRWRSVSKFESTVY